MKISDLPMDGVKVGMKIKGLVTGRPGTITKVDVNDDYFATIYFEEWTDPFSGFYPGRNGGGFFWNDCECEIIE